jgi:virulence factor lipase-like protein
MSLWHGYRAVSLLLVLLLAAASPALAAGVTAGFDLTSPAAGPFPSDVFTVADPSHNTGLRVSLPKPSCAARPTDCADIDVLNTLDGFNLQPRISVSFSGAIDVSTVSSSTVFLVSLGDTLGGAGGEVVGINQVVWDPATNTLHAESDELLDQHTRYALIVTNGVRDAAGDPVEAGAFASFRHDLNFGQTKSPALKAYRKSLLDAVAAAGVSPENIVTASVFSTQSATAVLEKIRDRVKAMTPAPATILANVPRSNVAAIQWRRQTAASGATTSSFLPVPALDVFPGSVGRIVFGSFTSPDWETPAKVIPAIGTRSGVPAVQGTNTLYFNLFVPAGPAPAAGWPVAIFGHGFTDSKQGAPIAVASTMAAHGIATIAINVVGHGGGGATGTLTIIPLSGAPVTVPDGGRGIDQDGNGTIDSTEGVSAVSANALISSRDGLRQTVADLMQLVRVIQVGIDIDGDGHADLDAGHIYYFGQSFGGIYGVKFIAVEPDVRGGVPDVPGGAIIEIARLSPAFRPLVGIALASRVPALCNAGPLAPPLWCFQESVPLRDDPTVTAPAPGAMPIQEVLDNTEWVSQAGNPVAYAPHLRKLPLDGVPTRPFIIQNAKGDQTVPNPTASAIIRAGDIHDRWTLYRNDLVRATLPGAQVNPHTFLTNIGAANPAVAALSIAAQQQIATFFVTDGAMVIDPDAAGPFFEVPISPAQIPLMEDLNF